MSYKTSSADLDGRSSLSYSAMGSSEDSVGIQKRSSAEMASRSLDADDEGKVARGSGHSTNDVVLVAVIPVWDFGILRNDC